MTAAATRRRSLIVPREHGAWGILLVPLFAGAAIGLLERGRPASLVPFTVAALSLFWLRTPVESWLGAANIRARSEAEFQLVRKWSYGLAAVSVAALAWLFSQTAPAGFLWIGAAAALAFAAQALVKRFWRAARTAAQIVGAAGLAATAPAAYYAATGRFDRTAAALWIANVLFAANQIHFVQTRLHALHAVSPRDKFAAGGAFFAAQLVLVTLLISACASGLFRWYAAIGFLPLLIRGFTWFGERSKPLAIHAVGKRELLYACLFGILLVAGFHFPQ
jgi:hypothetical protein